MEDLELGQKTEANQHPAHPFMCCLWRLPWYTSSAERLQQRLDGQESQKYLLSVPLQKKRANPCME